MKIMQSTKATETIVISLGPDELLLESIERAIQERDIQNGVVVSGIGTLKKCVLHYITHTNFPPKDGFFTVEGHLELLSLNGVIASGEPHLHGTISEKEKPMQGGHIERGCVVAYLAEVVIMKFKDLPMKWREDPERKIKFLEEG